VQVAAVGLFSAHGPLHARRLAGAVVLAVSVTTVPTGKLATHVGNVPEVFVQVSPAGLDVTVPYALALVLFIDSVSVYIVGVNVAVTLFAASIVTTHAPVPLHAPLHPENVSLPLGVAVSVTSVPGVKLDAHVVGQLIPAGFDATVPVPAPAVATLSANTGTRELKLAVTLRAALIVTVQVSEMPLHAPLHPPKVLPPLGAALSVTTVPSSYVAAHDVAGHTMPAGLDVTPPEPEPAVDTLSWCVMRTNVAVTLLAVLISTVQLPVPEHAPDHPANVLPALGAAVSDTTAPALNADAHVPGQLIEPGADVTAPLPLPAVDTES
jgi:hypothetical protein